METDIKKSEEDMGLFTKTGITLKREAATAAHGVWHQKSLLSGRRRGLFNDSQTALDAARAALDATANEPSDEVTGAFRDLSALRAEVARLEDEVTRREREMEDADKGVAEAKIRKDEADAALVEEEFNIDLLGPMEKAILALHEINQRVAAAQINLRGRPEFDIRWLTPGLVAAWTDAKNRRCNPSPKPEPHPCTIVEFIRDYSAGNVGGGGYVKGDAAGWDPEKCAELIAQGFAVWRTPSPKGEELVAAARKRLAQRPAFDSNNDSRVDVGWSNG